MKRFKLPADIKPCPFCASVDLQIVGYFDELKITCKCGAELVKGVGIRGADDKSATALIDQWNTREGAKQQ